MRNNASAVNLFDEIENNTDSPLVSTALIKDEILVTRDEHFARIQGLKILKY